MVGSSNRSRLGRPPASDSAETRARILEAARASFAELGYEATTNRTLAARAGITTGAIYHYFESKAQTYVAVHGEVRRLVYGRFAAAAAAAEPATFLGRVEAVLEEAHALNVEDPTLARFLAAVRTDIGRHPELRAALRDRRRPTHRTFFAELVDHGIAAGELAPEDRERAMAVIGVITVGLNDAMSDHVEWHRVAVDGLRQLLHGTLVTSPSAPAIGAAAASQH